VTTLAIPLPTAPAPGGLLTGSERRWIGLRLTLGLVTGGLLIVALAVRAIAPGQSDVAELVAGVGAAVIAVPAFAAAWHSLHHPNLHGLTDQLIALAMLAAWASGDLITAALLPLVMTLGHVIEERSLLGSQEAIEAIARLTRAEVRKRLPDGSTVPQSVQELRVGDMIELRAGDRNPVDGVVRDGRSSLDTAPITGESVPMEVEPGALIFGGSINLDGNLLVEITRIGEETTLGRVLALMQAAERAKPPATRLLERYAGRYMVLVLLAAAGIWFATGSVAAMLAVLVAACPCALVLAAPATSVAAIAVASRHGILVKGSAFLEELATANSLVLDKTGTVTLGRLHLIELRAEPSVDLDDLRRVAGTLGAASNHPVARALAGTIAADNRLPITDIAERPGLGIIATAAGQQVALGGPRLFVQLGIPTAQVPLHDGPIAGVARDGAFLGWALLADEPRPEARQAIVELRELGLQRQVLLTGDQESVAKQVAAYLSVPEIRAQALPEQKLRCVLEEVRQGYRPLVVGDGINDALALKAGAVGVAIGAQGADVAAASADLVLMTSDLRRLGTSIRLSRRCRRTIHTNVALGLGWTVVLIGGAASGVLGAGGAVVVALLHNLGTLAVMANAGRLLRFQETAPING
jgi:Zn2+/Cd2+-exporting ATPase